MTHLPSQTAILKIQQLNLRREGVPILVDFNWEILKGQHWVILGANGSGKTSLLSVLGGYRAPTAGAFEVLGETYGESDWRELRTHLGIVSATIANLMHPEEPAFRSVLTGRDGGIDLWGRVNAKERALALGWLQQVEAEHLADRCWAVLSQGERQRVLIARALIGSPKLLILDEPCAGLDPVAREGLLAFLGRLIRKRGGPSVVLVTHHVEEIIPDFTHALLLHQGRAAAAGAIPSVLTTQNLRRIFDAPLELRHRQGRFALEIPAPKRGLL